MAAQRRWAPERYASCARDYAAGLPGPALREKYGAHDLSKIARRCLRRGLLTRLRVQGGVFEPRDRTPKRCLGCAVFLTPTQVARGRTYHSAACARRAGRAWGRRPGQRNEVSA